jgi:copper chaperone CopZ
MKEDTPVQTIELAVPTVHCTACKLNIEEGLEEVAGVVASEVDLDAKRVRVEYDPATVDEATITKAIEDAGYPVG